MRLASLLARLMPLGFLAVFFVYPLATILWRGLFGADAAPLEALTDASIWRVAWFTTWQAALSTIGTIIIAMPGAWVLSHRRFRGRALVRAAVIVPFVLPTVVVAAAFTALFQAAGLTSGPFRLTDSVAAILLAHMFFNYAVVVRTVSTVWGRLDPGIDDEATMLGATPLQVFRRVTLPRLAPALLGAASIVFLFSFSSFGVVLLLGGPRRATLDTEIWRYATQRGDLDVASVIAVLQLVAVVSVLLVNGALQRRYTVTERARADLRATPAVTRHQHRTQALCLASIAVIVGVPVLALVERSLRVESGYSGRWYRELFEPRARVPVLPDTAANAIANSLSFAAVATLIALSVGIGAVVVSQTRGSIGAITDLSFLLPLGTSGVLLGLGLLVALDEPPLDLRTSWVLIPIAQALVGLPFVLRSVGPVMQSIDNGLREAAALLGARPARVWREVDLPIVWRAVLVGAGFAFAVSLGEFGATVFISRPDRLTVPVAIFRLLSRPGASSQGQAMALSTILMLLTAAVVLIVERVRPRGVDGW